ncbi:peptidyl-prolyl cis-trans isomerase [Sutcliffiella rhizosphaerae]|uniref:Peptidyl-prolyl cis-trans isomerase n=1 Tax=Sutcliffiella rhizosphaerae TaxID=2880967 RepID=A0ABM8YJB8_9BACI|nr:peptidyl-prolyl cis-trans isomerase [Sutcliffiella rhizosphaerae]CAG9619856.1 hypothetical protein BACCIP111883_00624 [Sutcliffiella rhizosphaerae]
MDGIIRIEGNVNFSITLDPGVWIFDDRRIDLDTYFAEEKKLEVDELETYTKEVSKHWDREIREGAVHPPTLKTEKKFEKEKLLTGTFGIKFAPFLYNAEPKPESTSIVFVGEGNELEVDIPTAQEVILAFSIKGKPLRDTGPVHVYLNDGSNRNTPLTHVHRIIVK